MPILAAMLLSACQQDGMAADANVMENPQVVRALAERDHELQELRRKVVELETDAGIAKVASRRAAPPPEAIPKCYKDYCPCDAPQGGPDMLFCDQLEQGIVVPVDQLIVGRSMRETRRQLATQDY
jgi:hypothetical protein